MATEDDDFGFSLVSESELKALENQLVQQVKQKETEVVKTNQEMQNRLQQLRAMILPLLTNLAKDETREYIYWPDRAKKIKAFIDKINKFVDG
jgi:uncharacterized phage infection (PIP) family protein YhgE